MQWLVPWHPLEDQSRKAPLAAELQREVSPAHVLFGRSVEAIAFRQDCDTVLFALDDGKVAEVHLTWIGKMERDPVWPSAIIYESLEAWAVQSMAADHAEWGPDD